ncbi:hypothetical protein ACIRSJ_11765 [Streptomyces virginiae]|uniref:hypothetical protein n=1 Tax=Streptomyces virginiae TaxID=1961 RepID=UPI0037F4793B
MLSYVMPRAALDALPPEKHSLTLRLCALGVQWHPERDRDIRVMSSLIEAANDRRAVAVPVG